MIPRELLGEPGRGARNRRERKLGIVGIASRHDQTAVHRKERIALRRRADVLPLVGSIQERDDQSRRVLHSRSNVRDAMSVGRTQSCETH